jgi:hypothetical protein
MEPHNLSLCARVGYLSDDIRLDDERLTSGPGKGFFLISKPLEFARRGAVSYKYEDSR